MNQFKYKYLSQIETDNNYLDIMGNTRIIYLLLIIYKIRFFIVHFL